MNTITIKQTSPSGKEPKTFRAYTVGQRTLGVSASTTGNDAWGIMRCATKTFIKYTEPKAEIAEIETRIRIRKGGNLWIAELQSK